MGQEITSSQFNEEDFVRFRQRLLDETALFEEYFRENRFSGEFNRGGYEIEACLVDSDLRPAPENNVFISRLASDLVVPELATFNVELNSSPQELNGTALDRMYDELKENLYACSAVADEMNVQLVLIGILPTIRDSDLSVENISNMERYHALNEEVLKMRDGRPFYLNIHGRDSLAKAQYDVMLEAATTSFQVHLQIEPRNSARFYNAAIVASAPIVAAAANSPYLFGNNLWQETRIPLFEQSVELGDENSRRVTFGSGYVRESILECFLENVELYPVLLPGNTDDELSRFSHLRFHNGTIWRWNRPLVGIEEDGTVHLRIEHRVMPAGPSAIDCIANAALFYGFSSYLASRKLPPEQQLSFEKARHNFYQCAQFGLDADVHWMDGRDYRIKDLLLDRVIPESRQGLGDLGIDESSANRFLDVIQGRVESGQNGAVWQMNFVRTNAADMTRMCHAYIKNHMEGLPVHEWSTEC